MSKFIPMRPTKIVVHCSASPNGKEFTIQDVKEWHLKRGFIDVGYHCVIGINGEIWHGRPLNVQGAHVEGENHNSIGICLIGTDKFKLRQLDALKYQLDSLVQILDIQVYNIFTHNYFPSAQKQGKTCPGFSVTQLLAWYLVGDKKALSKNILE
jgi:N-acetyl-anhydromuramyl-L-alanine amidase AmpD